MERISIGNVEIVRIGFTEGYPGRGDPPNLYIILGRPAVVFDAGFRSENNLHIFLDALSSCGLSPMDIGSVVLSHWHWDHTGLATWLSASTNAVFHVHPDEITRISGTAEELDAIAVGTENLYMAHGFSRETASGIISLAFEQPIPSIPRERISVLQNDALLHTENADFKVLHTPGHTPGSICLFEQNNGILLSADTLYGRLFPHPVAEIASEKQQEYSVLREYPRTLERLRNLDAKHCLPGHGAGFSPAVKVIDTISRFMERRIGRLVRLLRDTKTEMNAAQVLDVFFPGIGVQDLYHAAAEIILLLEVAEERGLVHRSVNQKNVFSFRAT